jgi:hypothetical protein
VEERHTLFAQIGHLNKSIIVEDIQSGIDKATELGLAECDAIVELAHRIAAVKEQIPLIAELKVAFDAGAQPNVHRRDALLREAYMQSVKASPKWLPEMEGESLFPQVEVRYKCLVRLERLAKSVSPSQMQVELDKAATVGLPEGDAILALKGRNEKLKVQLEYIQHLKEALKSSGSHEDGCENIDFDWHSLDIEDRQTCYNNLRNALDEVKKAGLEDHDRWVPELFADEVLERAAVRASIIKSDVRTSLMIKDASKWRTRKSTIMGGNPDESDKFIQRLQLASDRYDVAELASLLSKVNSFGLSFDDVIQYRLILQQLQSVRFVTDAIEEAEEEIRNSKDPDPLHVWRLMNLSDQLHQLGGDEDVADHARLSSSVAAKTCAGLDRELQQALTDKLFADLSKVPVLQKATVLEWQKAPITVPLTKVPGEAHMASVRNFRDILTWMADRPAADIERQAASDSVVRLLRLRDDLVDEIYCQVLKQMIRNPSIRSLALGWELLGAICKSTPPSDRVEVISKTSLKNMRSLQVHSLHG